MSYKVAIPKQVINMRFNITVLFKVTILRSRKCEIYCLLEKSLLPKKIGDMRFNITERYSRVCEILYHTVSYSVVIPINVQIDLTSKCEI